MRAIKHFQVRGIPGEVSRIAIGDRIIDYWAPSSPTDSLLIAHDGQNVFDGKTSTHRRRTWEIGQSVNRLSKEYGITAPAVIAIWNGNTPKDPWARIKELAPEKVLRRGVPVIVNDEIPVTVDQLYGDRYLDEIFTEHVPTIAEYLGINLSPEKTAMIGSSMGGLSTLYALANHGEKFHTALALSTHWSLGGIPLVEALINELPAHGAHNIYMSRGTKGLDADYEPFQLHADSLMIKKGYRADQNFVTRVHTRTGHNEKSWASYIDEPINFWLTRTSR